MSNTQQGAGRPEGRQQPACICRSTSSCRSTGSGTPAVDATSKPAEPSRRLGGAAVGVAFARRVPQPRAGGTLMNRNLGADRWWSLVILLIVASMSRCSSSTAPERHRVPLRRESSYVINEPGLYVKIPLLDNVRYFDARILTIDTRGTRALPHLREEERAGRSLREVAHHRRAAVLHQRRRRRGRAQIRLLQTINDSLRAEFGKRDRARSGVRRARQDHGAHAASRPTRTRVKIGVAGARRAH